MKNINVLLLSCFIFLMISCEQSDPNVDKSGENELQALEIEGEINLEDQNYQDIIYVPIYSDVYVDQVNQKTLLSATLSIRNTSFTDSLFISNIDYYNTEGQLVRKYIKNTISLPAMSTVNYVIEKEDDTGGPGANFIIELSARNKNIKPLIQTVMIGEVGNKGFSFLSDGYSIK